MEIKCQKSAAA